MRGKINQSVSSYLLNAALKAFVLFNGLRSLTVATHGTPGNTASIHLLSRRCTRPLSTTQDEKPAETTSELLGSGEGARDPTEGHFIQHKRLT